MQSETTTPTRQASGRTTVALVPGDGIGPEIVASVRAIFAAADAPIDWDEHPAGLSCIDSAPNGLPETTLDAIRRHRIALKGPTATPVGGGHKSVNVTIRKSLELYANVRPVKSLPGVATRFENVDLVIVRENIEDTYGGIEHMQTADVAQCLKVITRPGSLAICRYAFEYARSHGRKRVTCVQKANIMKITDGLFLDCFREVAAQYPDIQADEALVDATCMNLVTHPERFDVLVMPNLYGDIVSDLAAGLIGGLGVAPGGNIGENLAVFEAVHGTAPDIAGKGLANPTALLLSAVQMLRHLGHHAHAARIETGLHRALERGVKTGDLGGKASTGEFVDAIVAAMPPLEAVATSDVVHSATRVVPAAAPSQPVELELYGADLFVQCEGVPQMPERVGPFTLRMMSNRGTKCYPGPTPDILLVDWYRVRYTADQPVEDAQILSLIGEACAGLRWMHVEKLCRDTQGKAYYSKAQGE